jgi:hypothetical protein
LLAVGFTCSIDFLSWSFSISEGIGDTAKAVPGPAVIKKPRKRAGSKSNVDRLVTTPPVRIRVINIFSSFEGRGK